MCAAWCHQVENTQYINNTLEQYISNTWEQETRKLWTGLGCPLKGHQKSAPCSGWSYLSHQQRGGQVSFHTNATDALKPHGLIVALAKRLFLVGQAAQCILEH